MGEAPMFTASFYFLGLAASICAALFCLSIGKRTGKCAEVDLDALRAATVCLPIGGRAATDIAPTAMFKELTWDEKLKMSNIKAIWLRLYYQCKKKALEKQKAMYSWARTLSLCALLCLAGVLLEAEFDQPITFSTILAGFRHPTPAASNSLPTRHAVNSQNASTTALQRPPRN